MPDKPITSTYNQAQFAAELKQLCASKQTGTLFIVTAQGDSATVGLQQGVINALTHHGKFGSAALSAIKSLDGCKLKFRPNVVIRTDNDLPPTDRILSVLGSELDTAGLVQNRARQNQDVAAVSDPFGQVAPAALLTLIGRKLEADLALMLGQSAAQQLCDQAIAKVKPPENPNDVRNLVLEVIGLHVGKAKAETISQQIIEAINSMGEVASHATAEPRLDTLLTPEVSDRINTAHAKSAAVETAARLFGAIGPILVAEKLNGFSSQAARSDFEQALLEVTAELGEVKKSDEFVARVFKQLGS